MSFLKRIHLGAALKTRLENAIDSFEIDFRSRLKKGGMDPDNEAALLHWASAVKSSLEKAKLALAEREIDKGWNFVHTAEQHLVFGQSDKEWRARAEDLRNEATRIGGSREKTILGILGTQEKPKDFNQDDVYQALKVRNDFYNARYHKLTLRRLGLLRVTIILIVAILGVVAMQIFWPIDPGIEGGISREFQPFTWVRAVYGVLMGVLGAGFSMAYTLTSRPVEEKIPDQILGSTVTWTRLSIGAVAGFLALIFLQTELLENLFSSKILRSPFASLIIAFVAGFSERWIIQIIELVSKEKNGA